MNAPDLTLLTPILRPGMQKIAVKARQAQKVAA